MTAKKIYTSVLFLFIILVAQAQEEDIFGISNKAKNPKSESGIGNAARNIVEMFAIELSTGAGYQQFGTSFYSENPSLYALNQIQNFDTLAEFGLYKKTKFRLKIPKSHQLRSLISSLLSQEFSKVQHNDTSYRNMSYMQH